MENGRRLYELNIILGRCAVAIYDDCKKRRVTLTLVNNLLDSCTKIGGYVEGVLGGGDDGERRALAADEIRKARYTAKVIGDNKLCGKKDIDNFLTASANLLNALINPESFDTKRKPAKSPKPPKPEKKKKPKKQKEQPAVNMDPDGFDDEY